MVWQNFAYVYTRSTAGQASASTALREIVAFPDGRPFWNVEHYRVVTLHAECDAQGKVIWPERATAMVKGLGDIIWENDSDDWDAQAIPASNLWDELFSNDPQERHGRM